MQNKFEINQKKIKGSCQSGREVLTDDSKSDLPLTKYFKTSQFTSNLFDLTSYVRVEILVLFVTNHMRSNVNGKTTWGDMIRDSP